MRDAYVHWRGGAAYERLQGRHYRGTLKVTTLDGTFECWEDSAGRCRMDFRSGAISVSTRIAGTSGFEQTASGQVETLAAADRTRRLRSMVTGYATAFSGAMEARLVALPAVRPGVETPAEGFRVQFPGGDYCDFELGADGELLRCRERYDGKEESVIVRAWRIVDGIRMPQVVETISQSDGQRTLMEVQLDEPNPAFEATTFAKPETESRVKFAGGTHDSGAIPIELFEETRIFLTGSVGGKTASMLLDSGASVTVIDRKLAEAAGIKPTGNMEVRGMGGSASTAITNDVTITIGTMTLQTGMVLLMDLTEISRMTDHPIDVVLGKEVLNDTVTDIDFEAGSIVFREPRGFTAPAGMVRVPLTVAGGNRTVAVSIEGHDPIAVDFDLGNGGALLLNPRSMTKWGMTQDRPIAQSLSGGFGGLNVAHRFVVKELNVAGFVVRNLPAQAPVSTEGLDVYAGETVQGNLGMAVWNRFHLMLDFGRDQLYLAASPERLARPFAKNRSGLTTLREGDCLKVLFVDPTFPAAACEKDAEIVAIDDVPVSRIRSSTAWAESPAGTVVRLRFRDGREAALKLQDYY